jgi:addiction module HigA family antidote
MAPIAHPGRLLKRELAARKLSANRLSLDIGVPSGRITDILNGRRSITADTAVRLGRDFGNRAQLCSTCRASTTSLWWSGTRAERSRSGSGRRMRRSAPDFAAGR